MWITGDNGTLNKTIYARETHIKQAIRESLNLELYNILSGHISEGKETSKELSLDEFERLGYDVQKEEDADKENINCYIIQDGYVFEIEEREDGSQEVVFVAKETKLKPKIIDVHLSIEDSKLKIETTAKRAKEYTYIITSNSELIDETTENEILEVDLKELDNKYKDKTVYGNFTVKVIARNDNNRGLTDDNQQYNKSKNINVSKIIFDTDGGTFENGEQQFIAFLESGKKLNTINTTGFSAPTKAHNNFDDWYIDNKKIVFDQVTISESLVTISAGWNFADHNYVFARISKDATCEEDGEEIEVCTLCGDEKSVIVAALGHSYTQESTDNKYKKTDATCEAVATFYKSCVRCGLASATETFSSGSTVAHSYTSTSTDTSHRKSTATCQSAAVYYKSCIWCGANGSATFTSGSKAAHSYTANCSTCNGNGYTWKSANANWYYCYKGSHCIVINHCDTHGTSGLAGGYTAITVCSKCGSSSSLYKPLSSKGTGKQCKWCGTAKK